MIDDLTALRRARHEFERRLDSVTADQHRLPTPCDEWDVLTLVRHVIDGDTFATLILGGATCNDAISALQRMDDTRVFALEADAMDAAFAAAPPDRIVDHAIGPSSVGQFIGFRTADYSAHAWDLARALGQDDTLDPELVAALWHRSTPSAKADDDRTLDLQDRWLARMGRTR